MADWHSKCRVLPSPSPWGNGAASPGNSGLLHDSGNFISYTSHHKHSYHQSATRTFFGFTPRAGDFPHGTLPRKSLPSKKHENMWDHGEDASGEH